MDTFFSPFAPDALSLLVVAVLAYVIGSFPTGAIVARAHRDVDLTRVGSARTGATNAARVMGMGAGLIVLAGDLGKGALAVTVAGALTESPWGVALAGLISVVGHNRSLFLRGRGGRGVATGLGGLAVASTGLFILAALTGCIVSTLTRYISLGSIYGSAAAAIGALVAYATGQLAPELLLYVLVTAAFVIAAHRDSIVRLRAGTEHQLGEHLGGNGR